MSVSVADNIRAKLSAAFAPDAMDVVDDSNRHAGHAGAKPGGQTHFTVRIVSDRFDGMSRVERQRRIYAALAEEFAAGVHALSLNALSPAEAQAKAQDSS